MQCFQIDHPQRTSFLRSVIAFAERFLQENKACLWKRYRNSERKDPITNSHLSGILAALAKTEIKQFFDNILNNPFFDRGEVQKQSDVGLN